MREPLQVLVLEDEWPARNYLVQLVEQSGLGHVAAAVPSPALASEALAAAPVAIDVAFVDVHLAGERDPSRAGLTWIEGLAAGRGAPRIVLTTASSGHAMQAYELGVVDYLLKPFTEGRVRTALERLVAATARSSAPRTDGATRIAARHGRAVVFLARDEAFAFEAEGRLCFVHTAQGRLDVDLSLTSLEAVLGPTYLRVHRNWLVSTAHVRAMERESGELVLVVGPGQLRVQVARDRAAAVRDRLLASAIGLRPGPG
ncbi:LytR/AlgR family response regulator transcription factor [Nannocystis radixulma]|uniref:LytTR family DNA-binding domain-containing protein n=1 Tax=Nannocystis radixulma TaxID=2995305 RepID=A0ABT5AZB9_9BACT|nr:LytTR family DNA-binding domain-containing protein [Nannocystis radixulma]MDC0667187.1 LytTR family DNA-binding domain-containing protein [Nannocystis radixulma]